MPCYRKDDCVMNPNFVHAYTSTTLHGFDSERI